MYGLMAPAKDARVKRTAMAEMRVNNGLLGPENFSTCTIPLHELDKPRPGQVHIWYLDLGRLGQSLQHALGGEPARGEPVETVHEPLSLGQLRFARRFYFRLLLGAYLGIPGKSVKINRSNRGKPVLDESEHHSDLHFSIAKSEDRVLLGFSSTTLVGVDLEPEGRVAHHPLGVARRYFSSREAKNLEKLGQERLNEAFLRVWACKESVVKASGQGIANQFCRFAVETDPDKPPAVLEFEEEDPARWSLALVQPDEAFIGAVAMHHQQMKIRAFKLEA